MWPNPVSNNQFTVTLDFGNQFSGADRWLEIAVRTNGGGAFASLSPRQFITPTPYAIRAANFSGPVNTAQLTGTIAPGNIAAGSITGPMLAHGTVGSAQLAAGSVNTSALADTHHITHHWATNYWEFIPTIAVPGIPPFNPALGTLTQVGFTIVGERPTEWAAIAAGDGGGYTLGAYAQFVLNAPEKSELPTRTLANFTTPQQWASGWLFGGQTTNGTLVSLASSNGIVTEELERFTQPSQFFLLSNGASDAGAVGYGGAAGFSSIVRYATSTVTITYEYDPIVPPTLAITSSGSGQVMVSWTPNAPGFVLQESWSLATPNWTNAPSGATNPVNIPVAGPAKFYRLFKS